jgi:hypothetical protein
MPKLIRSHAMLLKVNLSEGLEAFPAIIQGIGAAPAG